MTKVTTSLAVNAGQTFIPPARPQDPGALPIVIPTSQLPPNIPQPLPPIVDVGPPITPPVAVVPEPVEFVSPGTGSSVK